MIWTPQHPLGLEPLSVDETNPKCVTLAAA